MRGAALYLGGLVNPTSGNVRISEGCMLSNISIYCQTLSNGEQFESPVIMNRVYESLVQFVSVQNRLISKVPAFQFIYIWDLTMTGCKTYQCSCEAVQFVTSARYNRLISNTYENVGVTAAYDGTPASERSIAFVNADKEGFQGLMMFEYGYYNCSPNVDANNSATFIHTYGYFKVINGTSAISVRIPGQSQDAVALETIRGGLALVNQRFQVSTNPVNYDLFCNTDTTTETNDYGLTIRRHSSTTPSKNVVSFINSGIEIPKGNYIYLFLDSGTRVKLVVDENNFVKVEGA